MFFIFFFIALMTTTLVINVFNLNLNYLYVNKVSGDMVDKIAENMLIRCLELICLFSICQAVGEKAMWILMGSLWGFVLGILQTINVQKYTFFRCCYNYFFLVIIIVLYNIAIYIFIKDDEGPNEIKNSILHNSIVKKILFITIILINSWLEVLFMKKF